MKPLVGLIGNWDSLGERHLDIGPCNQKAADSRWVLRRFCAKGYVRWTVDIYIPLLLYVSQDII